MVICKKDFLLGFVCALLISNRGLPKYKERLNKEQELLRENARAIGYEQGWAAASNFPPHVAQRYKELFPDA